MCYSYYKIIDSSAVFFDECRSYAIDIIAFPFLFSFYFGLLLFLLQAVLLEDERIVHY